MYAFIITVSVIYHALTPVKFYVISKERYRELEVGACMVNGYEQAQKMNFWLNTLPHTPKFKIAVECVPWVTVES